jgi:release factor glutamine methyltransferase
MTPVTIKQWVDEAERSHLTSDLPRLDAEVWASYTLNKSRSWLIGHPEFIISSEKLNYLNIGWDRIRNGFPLPYMLGEWEFYGIKLNIDPNVLIPRPETELLVDYAIYWLKHHNDVTNFLDVGTGSGCISVSILTHIRQIIAFATERHWCAIKIAQSNFSRYNLEDRARLVLTDLISGLKGRYHLICANLPYIPTPLLLSLRVAKHEPTTSLDGGGNGLVYILRLLDQIKNKMNRNSLILLEIDPNQENEIQQRALTLFNEPVIKIIRDLNGLQRLMAISVN